MSRTHFRACHLCEAMCGIAIEVDGRPDHAPSGRPGRPLQPRPHLPQGGGAPGRARGPGPPAPSAAAHGVGLGGDRAGTRPSTRRRRRLRRDPEGARPERGRRLPGQPHGPQPRRDPLRPALPADACGSRSRFSATSVDQLPQMLAALPDVRPPAPAARARRRPHAIFLLILGANPLASNGSLMTAPGIEKRLKAIRARGGRIVVVDPRRTETAALADRPPRHPPGRRRTRSSPRCSTCSSPRERLRPGRLADVHGRPRRARATR